MPGAGPADGPPGPAQRPRPAYEVIRHRAAHSPWLVLAILCLGFFMILLDSSIVNIAIPALGGDLDASLDQILWIINSYVLVYAVLLITAGRLGDIYGPKRLFLVGLAIFTLASVACGFAATPEQIIVGRIVQGVGGALLTPQTLSVITVIFPPDRRGAAFGVWGSVAGVATIAGPTLGGYLVTEWGWEWIFFVNAPIGVLTMVLAMAFMPELRLGRPHRLDWTGTLLVTVGLFLVTYGLIEGESHGWGRVRGPITIGVLIGTGIFVLAMFLLHQYAFRNREPLVPFAILADRNFSLMSAVTAAIAFAMLGIFLPLVIYLQSVLGLSAIAAGFAIAPLSVAAMLVAPFSGRLTDRLGGKWLLVGGLALWGGGMAAMVWLARVDAGQWSLLPGLVLAGLGLGVTFAPLQTVAMGGVHPRMAGAASGIINTSRQLGAVIGSAAVGALLQAQLAVRLAESARDNARSVPEPFRERFVAGFSDGGHGGAGRSAPALPPDLPEQARQALAEAGLRTFQEGFTGAMRASLVLPLVVLVAAALACLWIRRRPARPAG